MDGLQTAILKDSSVAIAPSPAALAAPAPGTTVSRNVFLGLVRTADCLAMLVAGAAITLLIAAHGQPGALDGRSLLAVILATWATDRGLMRAGAYSLPRLRGRRPALVTLALPVLAGTVVTLAALLLLDRNPQDALREAIGWMLATIWLLTTFRLVVARLITSGPLARRLSRRIVVFGVNPVSQRFIERLHADRLSTDRVLAVFDDRRSRIPDVHAGVPVLGRIDDLLAKGRQNTIDAIVVALPLAATGRLGEVCTALKPSVSDIYVTADLAGDRLTTDRLAHLGPNPVITISRRPLDEWAAIQKRALDIAVGILMLLIVAPVMAAIALAIRMDSEGPALFRQTRRGLNNNDFMVFKFRTMHQHLSDATGRLQTIRDDPRVTRIGRLLRKLSLDELPQLFNVLRGEMSLVGPRPHALCTRAGNLALEDAVSDYAMRHRVKPGITGWAQVNGFRGAIRNEAQLRSRVECDLYYINNWSIWFDVKILFMTLRTRRHVANAY